MLLTLLALETCDELLLEKEPTEPDPPPCPAAPPPIACAA